MKTVAVILARGGSKGIPGKNIMKLRGKPMLAYTIEAAIMSNVDETWVSTDDEEIAMVAEAWGAMVLMRPPKLAKDTSTSESALLHFAENIDFDKLVFIQPTSPLLRSKDINEGLRVLKDAKLDSIFSGTKMHWPAQWEISEDGWAPDGWTLDNRPRRQDVIVSLSCQENGAFYITSKELLLKNKVRVSGKVGVYEMYPSESFQVDVPDDLIIIEALLARRDK